MHVDDIEIKFQGRFIRTARVAAEGFEFIQHPQAAIASLRNCGARVDLFTFTQRLGDLARKYPYPMELDNVAALPVTSFNDWWKQVGGKTRNKVRLGEKKGVVVHEIPFDRNLAQGIWRIYNECPVRQGRRFAHYGKDLETVHAMSATFLDSSIFIGAFLGDELIGFLKLTLERSQSQAAVMAILSSLNHRDKSPTNALLAQGVRSCADRGIQHLIYSKFTFGKKEDSLRDFKEHNGFQKIDMPRYYVPLTPLGRFALRLKLHHGMQGFVPEALLSKMREIRASWYKRRSELA